MVQFDGEVSRHIDASPEQVFAVVTDIARLPDWNRTIQHVVDAPARLEPGSEWVVQLHIPGRTWNSRSRLEELDRDQLRFTYRSQTDDDNPSYAAWTWEVRPDGDGSMVTVGWKGRPMTFWRKALFSHVRKRQLVREVAESIVELERAVVQSHPQ